MTTLIGITGQDGLGGTATQLARDADGEGSAVNISEPKQAQRENTGRTFQIKVTTHGGAGSAAGTVAVMGRVKPGDDDVWGPVYEEVNGGAVNVTVDPDDDGVAFKVFKLAYDYRDLRLDLSGLGGADSVDTELFAGT